MAILFPRAETPQVCPTVFATVEAPGEPSASLHNDDENETHDGVLIGLPGPPLWYFRFDGVQGGTCTLTVDYNYETVTFEVLCPDGRLSPLEIGGRRSRLDSRHDVDVWAVAEVVGFVHYHNQIPADLKNCVTNVRRTRDFHGRR